MLGIIYILIAIIVFIVATKLFLKHDLNQKSSLEVTSEDVIFSSLPSLVISVFWPVALPIVLILWAIYVTSQPKD